MNIFRLVRPSFLALLLSGISASLAADSQSKAEPPTGLWTGSIQGRVGEVNFGIELKPEGNGLAAALLNATDRQPFSSATWDGQTLTLRLDYYDGQLTLHIVAPKKMEEYSRQTKGARVHIPVTLVAYQEPAAGRRGRGQASLEIGC